MLRPRAERMTAPKDQNTPKDQDVQGNRPDRTQPERLDTASLDIAAEKRAALRALLPEVFCEDQLDIDALQRVLGADVAAGTERFGLTWPGKADCMKLVQEASHATLNPCPEESVDFDKTQNLFIEGDNLEVLKLLQKSYFGQVKMIYIDPPYNTGNDFIYPDKFGETLEEYLKYTGQVDGNGQKISTNTDADGRFHSKWLSMMYPRLYLAKNLLRDDGVIFISIDDGEVAHLRKLCDQVFGEKNFLVSIVWEKRFTRSNNTKTFATLTENILCFRRSAKLETVREPRSEKADSTYSNPDNDPRGPWTSVSYVNPATKSQRPNLTYDLKNPISGESVSHPTNAWKYQETIYLQHVEEGRLHWGVEGKNKYPRLKRFLSEMGNEMVPVDLWKRKDVGTTDEASKYLNELMGAKVFDFPKPQRLIQKALHLIGSSDDIILDFFAGSGTTAHAVMAQNAADGGNRRYIMVQLPEPCDEESEAAKEGYETIAEISKERIRRAAKKIAADNPDFAGDLGFKVFKFAPSSFKKWDGDRTKLGDKTAIAKQLELHVNHIQGNARDTDILYEIILCSGFALTADLEQLEMAGKTVWRVGDPGCDLLICLDRNLNDAVIAEMAAATPKNAVCLDVGFNNNDELKTNAVQTFAIAARRAGHEIRFKTV